MYRNIYSKYKWVNKSNEIDTTVRKCKQIDSSVPRKALTLKLVQLLAFYYLQSIYSHKHTRRRSPKSDVKQKLWKHTATHTTPKSKYIKTCARMYGAFLFRNYCRNTILNETNFGIIWFLSLSASPSPCLSIRVLRRREEK